MEFISAVFHRITLTNKKGPILGSCLLVIPGGSLRRSTPVDRFRAPPMTSVHRPLIHCGWSVTEWSGVTPDM